MRTMDDMLRAVRAFQESRVFLSALELDLFGAVGEGATAQEVAALTGTDARAAGMLLNALVALEALEKEDGRFRCTDASRAFAELRPGLLHTVRKWESWSTLTACVKAGTAVRDRGRDEAGTEAFIGAMQARAVRLAAGLVEAVGTAGVRRMLDVGGGPGAFAIAFARAEPGLRAEVLDLPEVVPITRRHIGEAGLQDRVTARAGDLRADLLGEGYDLILVSAICHMLDETDNRDLFRRCAKALAPRGRLVIRDFVLEPDRTAPLEAALFALNMLTATPHGNVYTEDEYRAWLQEAGFRQVTRRPDGEDLLIACMNVPCGIPGVL
ncbi:MAG TPA: methyltransferase [Holophaga sp.]|nr:methyltransferase [Holophaga sp.]